MQKCGRSVMWRQAAVAVALLPLLAGCSSLGSGGSAGIGEADPSSYEFEFLRCSVETDAEYLESQSEPSIGGDTSRRVIAEYRITNLDDVRRRFEIRATRTDAAGQEIDFIATDTNRLDPGESSTELIDKRVVESDLPPYDCTAEVWDSVVDEAFDDD